MYPLLFNSSEWWNDRKETDNAWRVSIEEIRKRNYNLDIKNPKEKNEEESLDIPELLNVIDSEIQEMSTLIKQIRDELNKK